MTERDESYMYRMLEAVMDAWLAAPHQRFGQLLFTVLQGDDLFYIEDADLYAALSKWSFKHDKGG